jgi:hypothetical protein
MDGMISSTVVEGSMTRVIYLEYLEFSVVSHCQFLLYFSGIVLLSDSTVHAVSWKSKCPGNGQC